MIYVYGLAVISFAAGLLVGILTIQKPYEQPQIETTVQYTSRNTGNPDAPKMSVAMPHAEVRQKNNWTKKDSMKISDPGVVWLSEPLPPHIPDVTAKGETLAMIENLADLNLVPAGYVVFYNGESREIVRITKDGRVELGPGVSLDEATSTFWKGVEQMMPGACEQILKERKP